MKRIQFRRLPLFVELTVFIVCTLVLPLGLVTYSSNERLLAYSEEEIIRSAQSSLDAMTKLSGTVVANMVEKTINFSRESLLSEISPYKQYDEIQLGAERFQTVRKMANRLKDNAFSTSMIHSIYFWLQDSDYLISSRNDTVRLEDFHDLDWLEQQDIRDANSPFRSRWISRRLPFEVMNEPSGSRGYTDVISYLYRTTNYTTNARGLLVINLFEKDLSKMLNTEETPEGSQIFVLNQQGHVVSHPDKTMFLLDLSKDKAISQVLASDDTSGWLIDGTGKGRTLYCWNRAPFADWILMSSHSFDSLLQKASEIRTRTLVLTALLALACIGLAVLFSRRLVNPITRLINKVMSQEGVQVEPGANEIEFLSRAFDQIAEQEESLADLLRQRETGWIEKTLLDILKGHADPESLPAVISTAPLFPYGTFRMILTGVDRQQLFNNRYTPEQRQIMRKLAQERCESYRCDGMVIRAVLLDEDKLALVLNTSEDNGKDGVPLFTEDSLTDCLTHIQDGLSETFGSSVSMGVSLPHDSLSSLVDALTEADTAFRGKLLHGHGAVIRYQGTIQEKTRYHYPFERETHIMNLMQTGNLERLEDELNGLAQDLRGMAGLSNENILQIYNQLIGTSIRYFAENNIGIAKAYPNIHTVFLEMAWQETLDDLTHYLLNFYKRVMPYAAPHGTGDSSYRERIMGYLSERYRTEIDFQRMADDIGISYSYARKIIKDETGKSLLDYVNSLRIHEAKRLLRQTILSVNEVASQVGYANTQSLTRFFKKYEGMTPGEFRNLHG